jgi:hypothetical protein
LKTFGSSAIEATLRGGGRPGAHPHVPGVETPHGRGHVGELEAKLVLDGHLDLEERAGGVARPGQAGDLAEEVLDRDLVRARETSGPDRRPRED